VDAAEIEAVRTHWGKFIEMYNYDIPPDVTVRTNEIKPKDDEPDKMMP
jgi:hypothetical protein